MERAIGFLGTGLLGFPMAERLVRGDYQVHAWNRTLEKAEPLAQVGVDVCETASDAVSKAQIVVLMLSDAQAIEEVLFDRVGTTKFAGRTIVQMGTIGPDESQRFAHDLGIAGCVYLEAPVMGSIPEARAGKLIVMCGGEEEVYRRLLPLFETFGPDPRYVGPVGSAATLKLALNHLIAAHIAAFSQSFGLVRRSGGSVDLFMDVLRRTSLYAPVFDKKLPLMLRREFADTHFPTKHLLKDVRLFERAAGHLGLRTDLSETLVSLLRRSLELGTGEMDYSSLYLALDPKDE